MIVFCCICTQIVTMCINIAFNLTDIGCFSIDSCPGMMPACYADDGSGHGDTAGQRSAWQAPDGLRKG